MTHSDPKPAWTTGPLKAVIGHDGRHNGVPIMAVGEQFTDDEKWPYHPNIATVRMGRGCAPREIAEATAALFAAADDMYRALSSWPLSKLLGMIEDSGDEKMWQRAQWFMEVRDAALRKARGETP